MEKKLKKVQRGAGFGFVLLKILRILLIIVAVLLIVSLVVLAVVNENDLPLDAVKDGKLVLTLNDLNLNQLGLENVPDVGALVKDGVLTLDLKDAKLVVMLLVGAGILALAATYVLMLIAGNLGVPRRRHRGPRPRHGHHFGHLRRRPRHGQLPRHRDLHPLAMGEALHPLRLGLGVTDPCGAAAKRPYRAWATMRVFMW